MIEFFQQKTVIGSLKGESRKPDLPQKSQVHSSLPGKDSRGRFPHGQEGGDQFHRHHRDNHPSCPPDVLLFIFDKSLPADPPQWRRGTLCPRLQNTLPPPGNPIESRLASSTLLGGVETLLTSVSCRLGHSPVNALGSTARLAGPWLKHLISLSTLSSLYRLVKCWPSELCF